MTTNPTPLPADVAQALERVEEPLAMLELYHKTGLTISGRKLYPADLRILTDHIRRGG